MKKQMMTVSSIVVAGLLAMTLVACGGQKQETATTKEAPAQEQTQETTTKQQTEETTAQTQTQETTAPQQTQETTAPQQTETTETAAPETTTEAPVVTTESAEGQISSEEAKQIALNHAGVSEQDCIELSVELDTENGVAVYEVDFQVGTTEYNYDIDPVTGAIISSYSEFDD